MQLYKSEVLTMAVAGDKKSLSMDFLPTKGPRGGRLVIMKLWAKLNASLTTNGATTIQTAGLAALLKRWRIFDHQGDIVNLTGPELRAFHRLEHGRQATADATDVPINQAGLAKEVFIPIDFAPRFKSRRRWDYLLPADHLQKPGGMEIETPAASEVGTGGGLTIVSLSVTVYAECREEFDVQVHSRRELRSSAQQNLTDLYLPVSGGYIRNAFIFKAADHDTGGADQSSTTKVTIDALGMTSIEPVVLQRSLLAEGNHDDASTQDPFTQATARAVPLVWAHSDGKITDMFQHDGNVLVRLEGNSVSGNVIVFELLTQRTERSTQPEKRIAAAMGVTDPGQSIKTFGKTRKSPQAWGRAAKVMPGKLVA